MSQGQGSAQGPVGLFRSDRHTCPAERRRAMAVCDEGTADMMYLHAAVQSVHERSVWVTN